jgi:hypothetical protein
MSTVNADGSVNVWGMPQLPVKTLINVSAAGATVVVPGVAGKKLRVLAHYLVANAAVSVNFQSHTTTTLADGPQPFAANGGITVPFSPVGWVDTALGEGLDINLSAGVQVSGLVVTVAF